MIELLVSVCLVAEPARCKDVSLVFAEETVTPMQCLMSAGPTIARWVDEHPKWVAKRWSCQPAGRYAKI